MYIECIKGFKIGDSFAILQGEVFKLIDDVFVGVEGSSRNEGIELYFTEDQLANNFKIAFTKIVL
jgi:hypothetical protein